MVSDGDFSSDATWTLEYQWAITGGKLTRTPASRTEHITNGSFSVNPATAWTLTDCQWYTNDWVWFTGGAAGKIEQSTGLAAALVPGRTYRCTFTIESVPTANNGVRFQLGGTNGTLYKTTGTHTDYIVAGAGGSVAISAPDSGTELFIDNISVQEPWGADSAEQLYSDMVAAPAEDETYRVTFSVEGMSGGVFTVTLGGTEYASPITGSGDYEIDITASDTTGLIFTATENVSVTIDDVSVMLLTYPNYAIRGLLAIDDYLYVVYGPYLKRLDSSFASTTLNDSTLMSETSGFVSMAHIRSGTGFQIMLGDGSDKVAYLYDTEAATFTVLTEADHDFQGGGSVAAIDGYFLSHGVNTDNIYYSEVTAGTTWDAAEFTRAWIKTSNVQRVFAHERLLWAFKEDSAEMFYNSGASGADSPTFERVDGGALNIGLLANWSPASVKEKLFWLASDKTVQVAIGQSIQTVSTPQLSYLIEQMSTASDAVGYGYTEEGHDFYVLSFPTADVTYVYDASTGEWHERQSYDSDRDVDGRHRSNCYAYFQDKHVVGDFANTKLYELDSTVYTDDGNRIVRQRIAQNVNENNLMEFFNSFEVRFEGGVGLPNGQGSSPQAMLRISKDGGHTWSGVLTSTIGSRGGYDTRSIWNRLGCGRDFAPWISVSDPVKVVMLGAYLTYEQGYA
jgi:hypothetical protein